MDDSNGNEIDDDLHVWLIDSPLLSGTGCFEHVSCLPLLLSMIGEDVVNDSFVPFILMLLPSVGDDDDEMIDWCSTILFNLLCINR